jgi:hypothetical protein
LLYFIQPDTQKLVWILLNNDKNVVCNAEITDWLRLYGKMSPTNIAAQGGGRNRTGRSDSDTIHIHITGE